MIKFRPCIRFDGVYICKFHYVRYGYSENSEYRPSHDVFNYRFLRFFDDNTYISIYTQIVPKKILPKFNMQSKNMHEMIHFEKKKGYMNKKEKLEYE
jgi:hypothetical protein